MCTHTQKKLGWHSLNLFEPLGIKALSSLHDVLFTAVCVLPHCPICCKVLELEIIHWRNSLLLPSFSFLWAHFCIGFVVLTCKFHSVSLSETVKETFHRSNCWLYFLKGVGQLSLVLYLVTSDVNQPLGLTANILCLNNLFMDIPLLSIYVYQRLPLCEFLLTLNSLQTHITAAECSRHLIQDLIRLISLTDFKMLLSQGQITLRVWIFVLYCISY